MVRGDRPELRSQAAHTRQVLAAGTGNDVRDGGHLSRQKSGTGRDLEAGKGLTLCGCEQ